LIDIFTAFYIKNSILFAKIYNFIYLQKSFLI